MTEASERHLYIAWVKYQRRPESMRSYVGYDLRHVPPPFEHRFAKPFGYLLQAIETFRLISRQAPDVVWVQSPPTFVLHVVFLRRALGRKRFKIVADCHNGAFQTAWARVPLTFWLLNRCDAVMAHNAEVGDLAREMGVSERVLSVVETRPAQFDDRAQEPQGLRPSVLVPCSFNYDEPIDALIAAAREVPEADFFVTGRVRKAEAKGYTRDAPANLRFTDYLTAREYNELFLASSVVLGLTTVEGVQLSVANEAVGAGKAMVLSDTRILRDLFGHAALFAANEPPALAAALRRALADRETLEARSRELRASRETRWRLQIDPLLAKLA
jgi:glycosyltransferase involved in cell wall biosynthesis